jgi:uncharacterized membrane protein
MRISPLSRNVIHDPVLWVAVIIYLVMIGWLSIARYMGFNAGVLDLGTMYQAIASTLRGEPLIVTSPQGNVSRLAGHFELIYYAFAPLIALWPDPRVLLIGQTLLAASGAFPAYAIALRRLDSVLAARSIVLIYLLYPVALTAVLFDFHGDTLAMPMILWLVDALERRSRWSAVVWAGLCLLCKVYVAVAVAAIGAYFFLWGGQRRVGLVTSVSAVAYGALVFFVLRPLFEDAGGSRIHNNYVEQYFGAFDTLLSTVGERLLNALVVVGPVLLLAWRGWRWLFVSTPILFAVLISTGPGTTYHYAYHHYALVVPFIVLSVIEGAEKLCYRAKTNRKNSVISISEKVKKYSVKTSKSFQRSWRSDLIFCTVTTVLVSAALVDIPLNPTFWVGLPGIGVDQASYGIIARDFVKSRFLTNHVPMGSPIAISMFLGSHVAGRSELYVLRYPDDPGGVRLPIIIDKINYAVADALFDWRTIIDGRMVGGVDYEAKEISILLNNSNFGLIYQEDGLLLFKRGVTAEESLLQKIEFVKGYKLTQKQIADFGPVRLLEARIDSSENRLFRAYFSWKLVGDSIDRRLIAVSRLEGVDGGRVVHLPSAFLKPTNTWPTDHVVVEQFEIRLPADLPPGNYRWITAWYDPTHTDAYATDQRSRIGNEVVIDTITIR